MQPSDGSSNAIDRPLANRALSNEHDLPSIRALGQYHSIIFNALPYVRYHGIYHEFVALHLDDYRVGTRNLSKLQGALWASIGKYSRF